MAAAAERGAAAARRLAKLRRAAEEAQQLLEEGKAEEARKREREQQEAQRNQQQQQEEEFAPRDSGFSSAAGEGAAGAVVEMDGTEAEVEQEAASGLAPGLDESNGSPSGVQQLPLLPSAGETVSAAAGTPAAASVAVATPAAQLLQQHPQSAAPASAGDAFSPIGGGGVTPSSNGGEQPQPQLQLAVAIVPPLLPPRPRPAEEEMALGLASLMVSALAPKLQARCSPFCTDSPSLPTARSLLGPASPDCVVCRRRHFPTPQTPVWAAGAQSVAASVCANDPRRFAGTAERAFALLEGRAIDWAEKTPDEVCERWESAPATGR